MNKHVLIVRPEPAASQLASMLTDIGVDALPLPLIEFTPSPEIDKLRSALGELQPKDWILAVSTQAIIHAQEYMQSHSLPWPNVQYAAIGDTSGALLHEVTQQQVLRPAPPQTSESFLHLKAIRNLTSGRCLILRGNGGRDKIRTQLESQGVDVSYCETYSRTETNFDVKQFLSAKHQNIDMIIVTSGQQLEYLSKVVEKPLNLWLHTCILYVPSDRLKIRAEQLGFQTIYSVGSAANSAFLAILTKHKNSGIN